MRKMKAAIPEGRQRPVQLKADHGENVWGRAADTFDPHSKPQRNNGGFEPEHQFLSMQGSQNSDCDHRAR
jgi:hypothetical protein